MAMHETTGQIFPFPKQHLLGGVGTMIGSQETRKEKIQGLHVSMVIVLGWVHFI